MCLNEKVVKSRSIRWRDLSLLSTAALFSSSSALPQCSFSDAAIEVTRLRVHVSVLVANKTVRQFGGDAQCACFRFIHQTLSSDAQIRVSG